MFLSVIKLTTSQNARIVTLLYMHSCKKNTVFKKVLLENYIFKFLFHAIQSSCRFEAEGATTRNAFIKMSCNLWSLNEIILFLLVLLYYLIFNIFFTQFTVYCLLSV